MPRRWPRRALITSALLSSALLATTAAAVTPAAAANAANAANAAVANAAVALAPPPQQAGITLRVFDLQVALSTLCTLKPGQTPNVDKLTSTIDWTTTNDFVIADN